MHQASVEECVRAKLHIYFEDLGQQMPHGLHEMVMAAAEKPLLEVVLQKTKYNRSKAALWLGINRNTLHKKLRGYGLDQ